jgi:mannose-6-phosphate isomerase-like protein (cupin superfamily)
MEEINRMRMISTITILLTTLVWAGEVKQPPRARPAEAILQSFVEDFRQDRARTEPMTFGVRVREEGEWTIVVSGRKPGARETDVVLRPGLPPTPSFLYTVDLPTLQRIDRGELTALTAMGRARSSDPTPMDLELMPGYEPTPTFFAQVIPFTFHFWTRGVPEVIPYGKAHSRAVHGGNMAVFYYQKGFRSAWVQIEKGQHINEDPADQVNDFPTLLVGIRGKALARIGGQEVTLQEGQALFIPAGVSHEFWNPYEQPAEAILLMFGEGA